MKKFIGLAMLAGATVAGASAAHAEDGLSLSGNIGLTTDYVFRGISQTENAPAVQGGFDATYGQFYAGVWSSNVDFGAGVFPGGSQELDLYAGWKPTIGPVSADFGVIGYFYPSAREAPVGDWTYYEIKAAGSITPATNLTVGAAVYYSPEYAVSGPEGWYYELNGAYALSSSLSISGAVGHVDTSSDNDYPGGYFFLTDGTVTDSYTTWNLGATLAYHGFSFDLRYSGADEDITNFTGTNVSDDKVILGVKRSL